MVTGSTLWSRFIDTCLLNHYDTIRGCLRLYTHTVRLQIARNTNLYSHDHLLIDNHSDTRIDIHWAVRYMYVGILHLSCLCCIDLTNQTD